MQVGWKTSWVKNCIIDEKDEITSEKIPRAKIEYGQKH
jgi:hypothetical protein